MKNVFKVILSLFTALYRVSNGKIMGRIAGLNVLLLSTVGRKTGKPRTTPLGYFERAGGYVIIASNAGFDQHPSWFFNLRKDPNVRVRIKDREFPATAQIIGSDLRKELWAKLVSLSPQYGRYATSTKREIPLIWLQPTKA